MLNFVGSSSVKGRPKKECANQILNEKRAQISNDCAQLTGLYLLWTRRQICKEQFLSGCYYEELNLRLERGIRNMCKPQASSLTKIPTAHLNELTNKLLQFGLNEKISCKLAYIEQIIGYVHSSALSILRRVLLSSPFESAQEIKNMGYEELSILKKALSVINDQLNKQSMKHAIEDEIKTMIA